MNYREHLSKGWGAPQTEPSIMREIKITITIKITRGWPIECIAPSELTV
jgi:hypothetical protein